MRSASLFYDNPRLAVLGLAIIIVAGIGAWQTLARQEDPTMTERFGDVTVFVPGASAERMEALVAEPLERQLREVPEIEEISSISRTGSAVINVNFYDSVTPAEVDDVWADVREKVSEVPLPEGALPAQVEERQPIATTLLLALRWAGGDDAELAVLSRIGDELSTRLANIAGTRETRLYGRITEEVLVTIDPYRLAATGLTPAAVSQRIANADAKLAGGQVRNSRFDLLVEVDGELRSVERIAAIPLARSAAGTTLTVADVADVRKHRVDPPESMAFLNGERVVLVEAKMEPDRRIDLWRGATEMVISDYRAELPGAIALDVVFDQEHYASLRLITLGQNLLTALAIVLTLLVFFMGVRAAITVGLALPLSMAMVLIGLSFLDVPLHQMSVTGLIISLGLLIDNAIVVVEDFKLRRHRGAEIAEAIGASVRHLLVPLFASTATTILAFLPIPLTPGGTGEFTGTIGISVILAVGSSFLLAMTLVPAFAGFAERVWPPARGEVAHWWQDGYSSPLLTAIYRRSVLSAVRYPLLGLLVGCVLPVIGFALAPTLTQQFFPPVDRNQFQVQLTLSAQTSVSATRRQMETAAEIINAYPEVREQVWVVGESGPRVFYNVGGQNDGVTSYASASVTTDSPAATARILPELQRRLRAALPGARVLALPFEQGPPFDAPIEVRISGPELDTLRRLGDEMRLILSEIDGVTYTHAALGGAAPRITVRADENRTVASGLGVRDVPAQLNAALTGQLGGTVLEGTEELPVRVRLQGSDRQTLADVAALPVLSAGNSGVSLDSIAELSLEPAASAIERFQGQRTNTVKAWLEPFVLPAAALNEFEARLERSGFELPPGYQLGTGGEAEQRSSSVNSLLATFSLFATLMLAVVVVSLNSFRQAALIAMVGFLSIGLALFGVRLFGYPLGFVALIGMLGLVGLAINGSIIVLAGLKASERCQEGDPEAVTDTVLDASRHIISTTATTIGGFLPLILFGGTFWPPLATAIAGGVAGSAILALYTVPAIYAWLLRASLRRVSTQPDSGPHTADPAPA